MMTIEIDSVTALFDDTPNAPVESAPAQDDHARKEDARLQLLATERARLELEFLQAKAASGRLDPPTRIESDNDARIWLAWARANSHQAGCSCARCLPARRRLAACE